MARSAAVLLVALLGPIALQAADFPHLRERPNPMRAPVATSTAGQVPLGVAAGSRYLAESRAQPGDGAGNAAFLALLEVYRTGLSPLDGDRNDMAPATSLYAVQALKRHGPMLGLVLTAERLIHEPDEVTRAPTFVEDGRTLYLDPLASNTYWLPAWLR